MLNNTSYLTVFNHTTLKRLTPKCLLDNMSFIHYYYFYNEK